MHLLARNGDVSPSGADTPNGESLSGLDAGSTTWVPRARNMVALIATVRRFAGTPHRFACFPILKFDAARMKLVPVPTAHAG